MVQMKVIWFKGLHVMPNIKVNTMQDGQMARQKPAGQTNMTDYIGA